MIAKNESPSDVLPEEVRKEIDESKFPYAGFSAIWLDAVQRIALLAYRSSQGDTEAKVLAAVRATKEVAAMSCREEQSRYSNKGFEASACRGALGYAERNIRSLPEQPLVESVLKEKP